MNEKLVKKSIFKFCDYEYDNVLHFHSVYNRYYDDEEHVRIRKNMKKLTEYIYKTINIPMPLLEKDDSFYFEDDNIYVVVENVTRTDQDNVLYTVVRVNRIIDDESVVEKTLQQEKVLTTFAENKELHKKLNNINEIIKKNDSIFSKNIIKKITEVL